MDFDILENGDLKITASKDLRDELGQDSELWQETFEEAVPVDGWSFVAPEDIGALTDAPIICDDNWTVEDDGTFQIFPETKVWWFPNYMVENPMETLATTGEVIFTAAPTLGA